MKDYQIEEEVAIKEVKDFVAQYNRKPIDEEKVKELYPEVIDAVMFGLLVFDHKDAKLTLSEPVRNTDGDVVISELGFRTRILPSDQRKLSGGLDLKKDQLLYLHKLLAFIIDQPLAMLDKLAADDYKVCEQLGSLFI